MEKIILPLDGFTTEKEIMDLVLHIQKAETLAGESLIWGFKVNDALIEYGVDIIRRIKDEGFRVFADPKLYDIPNTIHNSLIRLISVSTDIVSVHCSANYKPVSYEANIIAGITVLTSMGSSECNKIYNSSVEMALTTLAKVAEEYNYNYLVCSAQDLNLFKDYYPDRFNLQKKICPGIRPKWYQDQNEDQKRVATPSEAIEWGADLLVIGRPILKALNKIDAIKRTNDEINSAYSDV